MTRQTSAPTLRRMHPRLSSCLAACSLLLALAGCTVAFTPGDAQPATYSPYPSGAASGPGSAAPDGMRGGGPAAY
jgi:hypothetical protein